MKLFKTITLVACFIGLVSLGAFATNATGTLPVTATVSSSCAVASSGAMAFGTYDPIGANATTGADLQVQGSVTFTCTNGVPASVGLDQGLHQDTGSTASAPKRQMLDTVSSDKLAYDLYSDSYGGTTWAMPGVSQTGSGSAQTLSVYGTIGKGQGVHAGNYADTVTITVAY